MITSCFNSKRINLKKLNSKRINLSTSDFQVLAGLHHRRRFSCELRGQSFGRRKHFDLQDDEDLEGLEAVEGHGQDGRDEGRRKRSRRRAT